MRKIGLTIAGTLTATVLAAGLSTAVAGAAATTCTGTLSSGDYKKLVVPAGATCDGTEATIDVRGGVRVGEGATFILAGHESTGGGTIRGGVRADAPASLQLHSAHVYGGLRMVGGNGFFSAVEDNTIHGGATIDGYSGFWFGFLGNTVHGSVQLNNNQLTELDDANEFVTNTIYGNLVCHNNTPPPQVGDSEGLPNVVSGQKVDQCAGL